MPNNGTSGTAGAAARLARITLPQRTLPVPRQLGQEWPGTVLAEHQAALDEATAGVARIVAVQMADREARRAVLADWVRRHAAQFPDGQLYFDMRDVHRNGAGDPDVMLARLLRALGVWEEFIRAGMPIATAHCSRSQHSAGSSSWSTACPTCRRPRSRHARRACCWWAATGRLPG